MTFIVPQTEGPHHEPLALAGSVVELPLEGPPTQLRTAALPARIARLATTARTWDELLETVVDETRDALHADVSSLYLLDRDGAYLTLAATNGLDRFQIGRARVPFGEGVTGHVAATHQPLVIPDVKADPRFLWVRGIDQRRFVASMLSVPLSWHDQVVGVLNVQTEQPRTFSPDDVAQLGAVADLLAGIVEKGRQQSEAEARVEALKAIDEARSELIALVTHELRTPLAVVRAYADLLAEEPTLAGRESRDVERRQTRARLARGDARADRAAGPPGRLHPGLGPGRARRTPPRSPRSTSSALVAEVLGSLTPLLGHHDVAVNGRPAAARPGRPAAASPDRRAPRRERGQVRAGGHDHHDRLGAPRGHRPARRERRGSGHPRRVARTHLRAVRPSRHAHRARLGHRPVRRQATRRVDGRAPVVRARPTARRALRRRPAGGRRHLTSTHRPSTHATEERTMITMSSRPFRILVVDDDPAMVGAITALVGTEGHQVITAYDGLTAVKRFREEHPDLVLLDLAMPGPDGFSVAGQMRAVGQAPILVVSGESGEAAKVRALGIGADDYLTKPFGKAELLARIAAIMRRVDRPGASGAPAGPLEAGGLVLEPGRHEARVGETALSLTPDRVPAARGAGPRGRRHRPAPAAGPCRLAGRDRSGPALAQAAPGAAARQGRGSRWSARRGGPGRGLSARRGGAGHGLTRGAPSWHAELWPLLSARRRRGSAGPSSLCVHPAVTALSARESAGRAASDRVAELRALDAGNQGGNPRRPGFRPRWRPGDRWCRARRPRSRRGNRGHRARRAG